MTLEEIRRGRQTPTQSYVLPYKETEGVEALKIYESTGREAQEWQSLLTCDIMAVNEDGLWLHTRFGYEVPRRNGKNEVIGIRELYGLIKGERILHTAHRTTTSHAAFERLITLLDAMGYKEYQRVKKGEEPADGYTAFRQFGLESIKLFFGGVVNFRTRSSKGGLGEGYDVLIIDEAQEYETDQESALKYVVSDSENPQTIMCGTPPTAVSSGTVFEKFRDKTLSGGNQDSGWAEWSVSEMTDPYDVNAWYECNPSMGIILTERDIIAEIGDDDIDFNIQRLGLWIKYNQKSAINENEWKALQFNDMPDFDSKLSIGIKYSKDGLNVAMGVAVKTTAGIFVEVLDCRQRREGNDWMLNFIKNVEKQVAQIVVDGQGAQEVFNKDINDWGIKIKPILPTVKEVTTANAQFENAIFEKTLKHGGQPSLKQVVSNCEKRAIGTNGGFGYKAIHPEDEISLMDCIILAHWSAINAKEKKIQKASC